MLDYAEKSGNFSKGVKTYRNIARGAGTDLAIFSGAVAVTDVIVNSELNASHLLDATVTGLSLIPGAGWIIGGSYLIADQLTQMYSGQSIGDHLNNAVGGPLIDWEY